MSRRLLSIREVAAEYGPSIWFWRERIWNRQIKSINEGKKILLDRKDIERFLEAAKR